MSNKDNDFAKAMQMMSNREPGTMIGTEEHPYVFFVPQWVEDEFNEQGTTTQESMARMFPGAFVLVKIMGVDE